MSAYTDRWHFKILWKYVCRYRRLLPKTNFNDATVKKRERKKNTFFIIWYLGNVTSSFPPFSCYSHTHRLINFRTETYTHRTRRLPFTQPTNMTMSYNFVFFCYTWYEHNFSFVNFYHNIINIFFLFVWLSVGSSFILLLVSFSITY